MRAVVRSVEIFPYQAKQFFVERLRFHEGGGFIDRQITDRRDIQIEVHPEVFHFTRAFRARNGKGGNKVKPVGRKFERFVVHEHFRRAFRDIVHAVVGEKGRQMAPRGANLGITRLGDVQRGGEKRVERFNGPPP